ncbi:hypothetical protein VNI00_004411 [Paramarasmius palmivorus]|uniref:NmrA-like domain-containing protein n=1 Tax=Paramarasmius palmivorus TaxID=297713 RepID=A0AAW0DPT6_9AGAR
MWQLITFLIGYIGGSVLSNLLKRPDRGSFDFRAVIRSAERAEKIKAFGVTPIVGSHSDRELMFKAASEADIVITMADCDDLDAAQAILDGLKKRYEVTNKRSILIHTRRLSGSSVRDRYAPEYAPMVIMSQMPCSVIANLIDNTSGDHLSDVVYDDENAEQIEGLPPTNPHRHVDTVIVAAGQEGYVLTYLVVPSTIYGPARNELVDAGISSPEELFSKLYVPIALQHGNGFKLGEGKNVWPNIEINEVVDIYARLFNAVLQDPVNTPNGREGYYFGNSDHYKLADVYKTLAQVFYELGKGKSPEPTELTKEELDQFFGVGVFSKSTVYYF